MPEGDLTSGWQTFDDPRFELRFRYPDPTPSGRPVVTNHGPQGDALRAHFASAERELYVEIMRFPLMPPDEEYGRHRTNLEQRYGEGAVSGLEDATLASRPARTYSFQWPAGRRIALFVSTAAWTYRVIYNPDSPLNAQVVATFEMRA